MDGFTFWGLGFALRGASELGNDGDERKAQSEEGKINNIPEMRWS